MRKLQGFSVLIAAAALTAAATITAFAGWSEQNGRWYYYNDRNGELVRNEWVEDGGKWYFMDYDGVMMTNSMVDDVYFVNESGVMVANSWVYIYEDWANQEGAISEATDAPTPTDGRRSEAPGITLRTVLCKRAGRRSTTGRTIWEAPAP